MALFDWMFQARRKAPPEAESSGLSRMESTRPVRPDGREPEPPGANGRPANRKHERMAQRELLYAVVRESMVNAGVLSASYKFKVLSLDRHGRQFLVMVDLGRECTLMPPQLSEIEAMIAQAAKARHGILVTSVYWRMNEYVAVGDPRAVATPPRAAGPVAIERDADPAAEMAPPATRSRFDPIQDDEVAAFRQAVATGVPNPAAAAAAAVGVKHGPQSYTLLTGFEDTELAEDDPPGPVLSGTQYGDLR